MSVLVTLVTNEKLNQVLVDSTVGSSLLLVECSVEGKPILKAGEIGQNFIKGKFVIFRSQGMSYTSKSLSLNRSLEFHAVSPRSSRVPLIKI